MFDFDAIQTWIYPIKHKTHSIGVEISLDDSVWSVEIYFHTHTYASDVSNSLEIITYVTISDFNVTEIWVRKHKHKHKHKHAHKEIHKSIILKLKHLPSTISFGLLGPSCSLNDFAAAVVVVVDAMKFWNSCFFFLFVFVNLLLREHTHICEENWTKY